MSQVADTRAFIKTLNDEVRAHPALHHPFLDLVASRKFSKRAWLAFAQQLYPHVHFFIPYMEMMLLTTFDMNAKLIVAKILLDEYGEDAGGKSHPELFRKFARAAGDGDVDDASLLISPLDPATVDLVETHMRICRDEPFLAAIGAIGQAHEFAIGFLFPPILAGLDLAGFTRDESEFFVLHVAHDVEHSAMLEDTMVRLALSPADCDLIRRGTLASLACRANLWAAMHRRMVAIDDGTPAPPTTERSLVDLTTAYQNVPSTFWPA
jgi:pyrroloquinoline quinone (PQQ) biosynthesis protein C